MNAINIQTLSEDCSAVARATCDGSVAVTQVIEVDSDGQKVLSLHFTFIDEDGEEANRIVARFVASVQAKYKGGSTDVWAFRSNGTLIAVCSLTPVAIVGMLTL